MGHRRESCEAQFTWSAVVVGAGDIARCDGSGDGATARLLDGISGTVFTVGDNVCSSGKAREVADCYGPSWERPKGRTKPSVGNHEYLTSGVSGYFAYFGSAAGPPGKGYYSYDRGDWHVVVLNSNCSKVGGCGSASHMVAWLRNDLAADSAKRCTLAYFHHPLFSSGGEHDDQPQVRPIWGSLYAANAAVVVSGHDHLSSAAPPKGPTARSTERGASVSSWWGRVARR